MLSEYRSNNIPYVLADDTTTVPLYNKKFAKEPGFALACRCLQSSNLDVEFLKAHTEFIAAFSRVIRYILVCETFLLSEEDIPNKCGTEIDALAIIPLNKILKL